MIAALPFVPLVTRLKLSGLPSGSLAGNVPPTGVSMPVEKVVLAASGAKFSPPTGSDHSSAPALSSLARNRAAASIVGAEVERGANRKQALRRRRVVRGEWNAAAGDIDILKQRSRPGGQRRQPACQRGQHGDQSQAVHPRAALRRARGTLHRR